MSSQVLPPNSEAAILTRMIQAREQDLAPELARYWLSFDFLPPDRERMNELATRAQAGTLTDDERSELESYLHVSNLLAVMQSKARRSLKIAPAFDSRQ